MPSIDDLMREIEQLRAENDMLKTLLKENDIALPVTVWRIWRMTKRKAPNGQGTIRQRADGTWEGRVSIGCDPGTGKYIQKYFHGKTQAEAVEKRNAFKYENDHGIYMEPAKLTVGQWLDIWRADYCSGIKSSTVDQYRTQVDQHLKPAFGVVKLDKLTAP